jgi:MoaA/NifB/PqqE/SkfB family radical SAM enzyme
MIGPKKDINMKPEKNNTYCKHPFREIAIKEWRGKKLLAFWPCCMMGNYTHKNPKYINPLEIDPTNLTPQEMYDHPRMQQLRDNLSKGIRDEACKVCWDQEDRGLNSFRLYSDENFGYDDDGLSVIDITASNVCNLRCRMCTPTASHQLMADHQYFDKNNLLDKVSKVTDRWGRIEFIVDGKSKPVSIEATKSFQWEWLLQNTDKIKVLKASGGEPFYDNKVIQLLYQYVRNDDAKNTTLIFHTNATQFDDNNISLINNFKKNKHTFSIDGIEKVYEFIRFPSKFSDLEISVKNYIENVRNYDPILNFVTVVTAHNILNLDEYLTWAKKLYPGVCCQFSEVYSRDRGIAIKHLSKELLELAKQRINKHRFRDNGLEDGDVVNLLLQIDDAIKNNNENRQKVKDECELFDMARNQNFRDYLDPILVEWLDSE